MGRHSDTMVIPPNVERKRHTQWYHIHLTFRRNTRQACGASDSRGLARMWRKTGQWSLQNSWVSRYKMWDVNTCSFYNGSWVKFQEEDIEIPDARGKWWRWVEWRLESRSLSTIVGWLHRTLYYKYSRSVKCVCEASFSGCIVVQLCKHGSIRKTPNLLFVLFCAFFTFFKQKK